MCALGAPARLPAETGTFADAPGMRRRGFGPTPDLPSASTKASLRFHYALVFGGTETRAHVRLLGPCFKTGRMESQPNSSPTPTRTAEQRETPARDRRRRRTTGSPKGSDHIARSDAAASAPAHRDTRPRTGVDRTGARLNPTVGGRTTAHPRGLKRTALREARRAPTCPPHQAPRGDAMSTDREAQPQGRTNAS